MKGSPPTAKSLAGPITLAFITVATLLAIRQYTPPAVVTGAAPPWQFSAARAMADLRAIARAPHPTGSAENARVRGYLIGRLQELGLSPQIQSATVTRKDRHGVYVCATVNNIVARLNGVGSTGAVMLVSHYDSVPTGPGAGDDGAAVAAILETVRVLRAHPPLRNDLILLFTDGEELSLLGAKSFVEEHPWARDVRVALNFEARGDRGPSLMFETSDGNGRLVSRLARSAQYPDSSSLFFSVYKRMPNDTDFTILKGAGLTGLNFAFIGGHPRYHTMLDTPDRLDPRSLQHHGSYALALARDFGKRGLGGSPAGNAIYFNLGGALIHYPESWVIPLALVLALAAAVILISGLRRRRLTLPGVVLGFFAFAFNVVVAAAVIARLEWRVMDRLSRHDLLPYGASYGGPFYAASSLALVTAFSLTLYAWLSKRTDVRDLSMGALLGWVVPAAAASVYAPGLSYLFTWPLAFALAAFGLSLSTKERQSTVAQALCTLVAAVPAIVLVVPIISLDFDATKLSLTIGALALGFLFGLFVPYLDFLTATLERPLAVVMLVLGLVLIAAGNRASAFDAAHPRPDSIFYRLNADTGKALWLSADRRPDHWTSQFFGEKVGRALLSEIFPASDEEPMLESPAPALSIAAPELAVLADSTGGGLRTVKMRVSSRRRVRIVWLSVPSGVEVRESSVNGKPAGPGDRTGWHASYCGASKEGFELELKVAPSKPLAITVTDQTDGLPEIAGLEFKPRPRDTMPRPAFPCDSSTLVSKSFALGGGGGS